MESKGIHFAILLWHGLTTQCFMACVEVSAYVAKIQVEIILNPVPPRWQDWMFIIEDL